MMILFYMLGLYYYTISPTPDMNLLTNTCYIMTYQPFSLSRISKIWSVPDFFQQYFSKLCTSWTHFPNNQLK